MININMNDVRFEMPQRRVVKRIPPHEVLVSPPPYASEEEWAEYREKEKTHLKELVDAENKRKEEAKKERDKTLPKVVDNDDVIGYDSKGKAKKRKKEDNAKVA